MTAMKNGVRSVAQEGELYYLQVPHAMRPVAHDVRFVDVDKLLEDEESCSALWGLITSHFKTRRKFLTIWPSVRYVAMLGRGRELAGFLLVSAPLNWQIDYVVVRPDRRHEGIALSLVNETMNQALIRNVPYVMLSSREGLQPLYEGACGFSVVGRSQPSGRLAAIPV